MGLGGAAPVKYKKNTGARVWRVGWIPDLGVAMDMTTRRERTGARLLYLAHLEASPTSHDPALITILNGYIINPKRICNTQNFVYRHNKCASSRGANGSAFPEAAHNHECCHSSSSLAFSRLKGVDRGGARRI
jgi:hypothetical protein